MDSMDTDMIEAESAAAPPHPPPHVPDDKDAVIRQFLTSARQFINQGKPSEALQAVIMAMKTKGGDEGVVESLKRAGELYRNKIEANTAADELASLFAECAIAEADMPSRSDDQNMNMGVQSIEESSILAESGRKQIVLDAFSDGSSFVCLQCGGLVSNLRKDEHYTFWCCKI